MKIQSLVLLGVIISSCAPKEKENGDRFEELFRGEINVVDLTHPLSESSPYWPDSAGNPFNYDTILTQPSGAPGMGKYNTPEHYGTHMDAPIHTADGKASVDTLTPTDLFGPAVVIDISEKCASDADYTLSVDDINQWENQNGPIPNRAIVLLFTGWSKKWSDYNAYKNEDKHGQMHFPGYSVTVAKFLVEERNILGIGIDTFSVDAAVAAGFPVHTIVNGAGKFQLENVANLDQLPATGAYLINAPIKIEGGSGGQVRIFAVVP